ncbi:MAG TPA: S8 family serine peptidase [Anaerolineales bacterium]|nr:S8 family serine peptidase [Anaerolineales bacterium]
MPDHNIRERGKSSAERTCPVCNKPIAPELYPLHTQIDAATLRRLQDDNPDWEAALGACPECVYQAALAVRLGRGQASIQDEYLLPYPVYTADETQLIPVHRQLEASSQYTGRGVTLAFLDSGFYPHPDLTQPENRILCYVDATGAEPIENIRFNQPHITSWHGLMTSSVAAGNGFMSDSLYRGIAYQANLVLVKTGHPTRRGIREADITRALKWVVANQQRYNIRIVNISLGGDIPANGKLSELDKLVEKAVAQGMVVVAAAGNDGVERLVSPASAPAAITVGGLDQRNSFDRRLWRMYPSNYGRVGNKKTKPEIIAPAVWLAAPMLPRTRVHNEGMFLWRLDKTLERLQQAKTTSTGTNDGDTPPQLDALRRKIRLRMIDQKYIHPHYQHVDGTSMAAPLVSAIVALMLEVNPGLTPGQVKQILMSSATPLEGIPVLKAGAGLVNAGRAVAAARRASRGVLKTLAFSPHVERNQVTFYYFDPLNRASRVALIGSFNGWNPAGYALGSSSPGLWQLSIPLPPKGSYRYKFLLDGSWVNDPENPNRIEDGYGGFSSILEIKK